MFATTAAKYCTSKYRLGSSEPRNALLREAPFDGFIEWTSCNDWMKILRISMPVVIRDKKVGQQSFTDIRDQTAPSFDSGVHR